MDAQADRPDVEIVGSLLQAVAAAGESLEILLATEHADEYDAQAWYPLSEWTRLTEPISRYDDPDPIFLRLGIEQIHGWFRCPTNDAPLSRAEDFIRRQADSVGFKSTVRGPIEQTGTAELLEFDPVRGRASIRDTSFMNDASVRGIFIGGLTVTADLLFYDVQVRRMPNDRVVDIRYVTPELAEVIPGPEGRLISATEWRLLRLSAESARSERYWKSINRTLNSAFAELQVLATLDPLTGVLNRRELLRQLEVELARHRRHAIPVSVLYMDLDDFKLVNDQHGHAIGDAAIVEFTRLCVASCRGHDVFGRVGGEEFVAFLPHTTLDQAVVLAERILERVRRTRIDTGASEVCMTASVGVAEAGEMDNVDTLIKVADERMLDAKRGGRDRIVAD